MQEPVRDAAYWRHVGLLAVAVISIGVSLGRFSDWRTTHSPTDLKFAVVFAILLSISFALTSRRWQLLFEVSSTFFVLGAVGTILHRTLILLPIMAVCAAVSYLVIRFKFHKFK